jgi:diacylglycerol kinase family enzyme
MERSFAEAAGQKLEVLILPVAMAPSGQLQKHAPKREPYLIPLPGGTMNMLPRALYGNVSWEEALKNTLATPSAKVLSGGRIAGKQFLVAAVAGAPALWAEPRESIREGDIVDAVQKGSVAFRNMFERKLEYRIPDGIKGETEAVALICPLVSEEMSGLEQALEAAVIDVESAAEVVSLGTTAAFGKWRNNRNILLIRTKRVSLQSSTDIPAMLDGENVHLGTSVEINFVSRALSVLVPAK